MLLQNKATIVTGSSRGIGKAIVVAMAGEGAKVVVNYVSHRKEAEQVVTMIRNKGGKAISVQADISRKEDVERLIKQALNEYGRIDVLVNNAAVVVGDLMIDTSYEDWHRTFGVNIHGGFYCTQIVSKEMIKQGEGGRIINISSVCGAIALAKRSAYSATKGAMEAFTRCSALELAPYKITVNAVAPGATNTEINIPLYTPSIRRALERRIALGRIAEPEDMPGAVIFFASESAKYITGQVLLVDGGWSACDYMYVEKD